jgi:hypothetical protein
MIVPAVLLGGFAVFMAVYFVTSGIRYGIAELRGRLQPGRQKYQYDYDLDPVGVIVGILGVVLLVLSLFVVPREWAVVLWTALTVLGIGFGLFTFLW